MMRAAKFQKSTRSVKPRPIGIFTICVAALGFMAGFVRNEPVLILAGAVFTFCLAYCFLSIFLTVVLCKKKIAALSVRMACEKVTAGKNGTLQLSRQTHFFQMPTVLVRYKLLLATKDGKKIEYIFDGSFFKKASADFPATRRGAYYGMYDNLTVQDVFGFFCYALPLPQVRAERLLVLPVPAETYPAIRLLASGSERRSETEMHKTDDLTEQRPYIPGDDPRRINWKLYSHASELFVRQEEHEPPPHSQFVLLMDTDTDGSLYPAEEGATAVDALCSTALSLLLEKTASGIEVLFGFTGGGLKNGLAGDLPAMLARPYRTVPGDGYKLPTPSSLPGPHSILVMALARKAGMTSGGLRDFISKRQAGHSIQVVFFYYGENQKNHAEASAIIFSRMTGIETRTEPLP